MRPSPEGLTRRPLPLDDPAIARLDPAARAALGRHWTRRACSEGQVSTAFAALAASLRAAGAEAIVLELLERAVDDEVRHSRICAALAGAYLGETIVAPAPGPVALPVFAAVDEPAIVATLQVVGMCCVGETLATVWLERCLSLSRTPLARAANREHLSEEIDHARAGWAHLGARSLPAAHLAAVERHLVVILRAALRDWLAAGEDMPMGTGLEDHGVPSPGQHRAAIVGGLREVVLPGFARAGLDVGPVRRWLEAQA